MKQKKFEHEIILFLILFPDLMKFRHLDPRKMSCPSKAKSVVDQMCANFDWMNKIFAYYDNA